MERDGKWLDRGSGPCRTVAIATAVGLREAIGALPSGTGAGMCAGPLLRHAWRQDQNIIPSAGIHLTE